MAKWTEHRPIASGRFPRDVRSRILAVVCFGFNNHAADAIEQKEVAISWRATR